MARLPAVNRDEVSTEKQPIWDRVMSGRTGTAGPYGVLVYAPAMAERISVVEDYFRQNCMLDTKDKELVILVAARELGARFPWSRHEIRAREAGMPPETIEALRENHSLEALTPHERLMVEVTLALLRERRLSEDLFSRALAELGPERLVEMVGLVGHYNLISTVANVFDLEVPKDTVTF
jgi:4-carboxymuconolactone decarboxylase